MFRSAYLVKVSESLDFVFHQVTDMPRSRYSAGCGLIEYQDEVAVIMAGSAFGETLSSSDIYLVKVRNPL